MSLPISSKTRWSAIFLGAFVAFAIEVFFAFLGSTVGLYVWSESSGFSFNTSWIIGLIYFLITLFVAFFAGGFLAARQSDAPNRFSAVSHAVCAWGLVTTSLVLFSLYASALIAKSTTAALVHMGVFAEQGAGVGAFLDELSKRRVEVVTDLSVLHGKAVSYLKVQGENLHLPARTIQESKKAVREVSAETKTKRNVEEAVQKARAFAAKASLSLLLAIFISGLASAIGGTQGTPNPPSKSQAETEPSESSFQKAS